VRIIVKDGVDAVAATAGIGPIEVDDEGQEGKRPKRAPIIVGVIAAREDMEAQCRRQQEDTGPDREDDAIVEDVRVRLLILRQDGAAIGERLQNDKRGAREPEDRRR
jgi:hypothetical protein